MKDRWTAEEYRRFRETGKMPEETERRSLMTLEGKKRIEELLNQPKPLKGAADPAPDSEPKKRRKYGNEVVYVDGIRFDSKHEAAVYQELMLRVRAGKLKCVCRQVHFDLGGGPHAQKDSRYEYIADFVTLDNQNIADVIDAKSDITRKNQVYVNKKKAMLALWGISITEM